MDSQSLARDIGRHGARLQAVAASLKTLIDDAAGETPAAHDESCRHAMNQDIALIDREIQERFAAIVVPYEEDGKFAARGESQACLHAIVRGSGGPDCPIAAIPVVGVARSG